MSKSDMSDLIERSEVLKQLRLNHKDVVYIDKNECARRIEAIPSARPKGEWIIVECYPIATPSKWCENDEKPIYTCKLQCSKCGFTHNFLDGHTAQYNFCPQCGSDNREREGE